MSGKRIVSLLLVCVFILYSTFPVYAALSTDDITKLKVELENRYAQRDSLEDIETLIMSALYDYYSYGSEGEGILTVLTDFSKSIYEKTAEGEEEKRKPESIFESSGWFPEEYSPLAYLTDPELVSGVTHAVPVTGSGADHLFGLLVNKYILLYSKALEGAEEATKPDTVNLYMSAVVRATNGLTNLVMVNQEYRKSVNASVYEEALIEHWGLTRDLANGFAKLREALIKAGGIAKDGNTLIDKPTEVIKTVSAWDSETPLGLFVQKVNNGYYMTQEVLQGQALSSLYKPLETNVYDREYIGLADSENFNKFDQKYGALRKVVMIAEGGKAVSTFYNTGNVTGFRVATLKDLLQPQEEIFLMADEGYYNSSTMPDVKTEESTKTRVIEGLKDKATEGVETDTTTPTSESTQSLLPEVVISTSMATAEEANTLITKNNASLNTNATRAGFSPAVAQNIVNNFSADFTEETFVTEKTNAEDMLKLQHYVNSFLLEANKINQMGSSTPAENFIYPSTYAELSQVADQLLQVEGLTTDMIDRFNDTYQKGKEDLEYTIKYYNDIRPLALEDRFSTVSDVQNAEALYQSGNMTKQAYEDVLPWLTGTRDENLLSFFGVLPVDVYAADGLPELKLAFEDNAFEEMWKALSENTDTRDATLENIVRHYVLTRPLSAPHKDHPWAHEFLPSWDPTNVVVGNGWTSAWSSIKKSNPRDMETIFSILAQIRDSSSGLTKARAVSYMNATMDNILRNAESTTLQLPKDNLTEYFRYFTQDSTKLNKYLGNLAKGMRKADVKYFTVKATTGNAAIGAASAESVNRIENMLVSTSFWNYSMKRLIYNNMISNIVQENKNAAFYVQMVVGQRQLSTKLSPEMVLALCADPSLQDSYLILLNQIKNDTDLGAAIEDFKNSSALRSAGEMLLTGEIQSLSEAERKVELLFVIASAYLSTTVASNFQSITGLSKEGAITRENLNNLADAVELGEILRSIQDLIDTMQDPKKIADLAKNGLDNFIDGVKDKVDTLLGNKKDDAYYEKKALNEAASAAAKKGASTNSSALTTALDPIEGIEMTVGVSEAIDTVEASVFDEFFQRWRQNGFNLGITPMEQALAIKSAALDTIVKSSVLSTMKEPNSAVNEWTGVAVQRDIYTDKSMVEYISSHRNKPLFLSASTSNIAMNSDVYYNHMMLDNIKNISAIRYTTTLDMSSPLFIDIYGNIMTESGVIVIPFSANATLNKYYNLLTSAFLLNYGNNMPVRIDKTGEATIAGHILDLRQTALLSILEYPIFEKNGLVVDAELLIPDSTESYYILNPISIATNYGPLDVSKLDSSSAQTLRVLYNCSLALYTKGSASSDFNAVDSTIHTNIYLASVFLPVIRGADLTRIDYIAEKIAVPMEYDSASLKRAVQLANLMDSLQEKSINTNLNLPDLQYMDGFEYIIFYMYKVLIILFLIYAAVQIYLAAASAKFSAKTLFGIIGTFLMMFVVIIYVPILNNYTYYYSNRTLLQQEALLMALLNEEKKSNNIELGVVEARSPNLSTKLTLEVKKVPVNWYDYMLDVIYSPDVKVMEDVFAKHMTNDLEVGLSQYTLKGNKLYLDVDALFSSSEVYTDFNTHQLKQVVHGEQSISFRLPYYAILDYLVYNVNQYNNTLKSYNYNKFTYGDGRYRSSGLSSRYFDSTAFRVPRKDVLYNRDSIPGGINPESLVMATYDRLGLFQFYNNVAYDSRDVFEGFGKFNNSQWYVDNISFEKLEEIADVLDDKAITFVRRNASILGRVSDENFLKAMALHLSLEYNKAFNVPGPQAIEISNIANEDLIRFSMMPTADVMSMSPYDFAKFTLDSSGTMGILMAAYLGILMFVESWVKPIVTMVAILALIASYFIYRLMLGKKTKVMKGLGKTVLIICLLNLSFSVFVKTTFMAPNFGWSPQLCIMYSIFIHMVYLYMFVWLGRVVVRNWKDYGDSAYDSVLNLKTLNVHEISRSGRDTLNESELQKDTRRKLGEEYLEELESIEQEKKQYRIEQRELQ